MLVVIVAQAGAEMSQKLAIGEICTNRFTSNSIAPMAEQHGDVLRIMNTFAEAIIRRQQMVHVAFVLIGNRLGPIHLRKQALDLIIEPYQVVQVVLVTFVYLEGDSGVDIVHKRVQHRRSIRFQLSHQTLQALQNLLGDVRRQHSNMAKTDATQFRVVVGMPMIVDDAFDVCVMARAEAGLLACTRHIAHLRLAGLWTLGAREYKLVQVINGHELVRVAQGYVAVIQTQLFVVPCWNVDISSRVL